MLLRVRARARSHARVPHAEGTRAPAALPPRPQALAKWVEHLLPFAALLAIIFAYHFFTGAGVGAQRRRGPAGASRRAGEPAASACAASAMVTPPPAAVPR